MSAKNLFNPPTDDLQVEIRPKGLDRRLGARKPVHRQHFLPVGRTDVDDGNTSASQREIRAD